ncbi:glycoside hydrolase family 6 protein [Streptomyces tailanensis]|uniref:glycoside hydrolase family 6 protein n=1 Tax=Streptomyces tailanensis TaxID=2569858 RepID=UPI001FE780E8|nr:glycoside hydrolase family 6 protein [Streptomyces tailanensis]
MCRLSGPVPKRARPETPAPGRAYPRPRRARLAALLTALGLLVAVATAVTNAPFLPGQRPGAAPPPALPEPRFPAVTRLYTAPDTPAARWVREHPQDPRVAVIRERIASRPQGSWFTDPDPLKVEGKVRAVVDAARARGAMPVLVAYAVHHRDCSGHSTGGTADLAAYRAWVEGFARGIGSGQALVVLEPDALALADCLSSRERRDRFAALSHAGRVMRRDAPRARVYYDAGNSRWHPAHTMADRLRHAGATRYGDGIALNVSNFNRTRDEIDYGYSVLRELDSARLTMVIDTSRNGAGPARGNRACDPPGRRLGQSPTAGTGVRGVDAYLWVKPPGQADGCSAAAGTFDAQYAYRLTR